MNFNSQICTTEEQSKRLLALGLKRETADMMYIVLVKDFRGKDVPNAERVYSLCTWYEETSMSVGLEKREYIPAWSLHRLIEMMPYDFTDNNNNTYELQITCDGAGYDDREDLYSIVGWWRSNTYDDIIDCIEWLIKEGYFNKEYLEE